MTERSTDFRVETTGDATARAASHGLSLSSAAAARLARLSEARGTPLMLRVAVDGGGCSGFQYRFDLVETAEEDDIAIRADGRTAVVDPVSLPFLAGSVIDFVDDLAGAQFVVRNPNAASSCGCGVSFSI
ncbi:iron-sulfur cluster insertion protein ErpA [Brevundimonas sp. A19_0]|uniref:iron-sulfur cluster insertion protein ErpA n=1 Tax=Brevundimonas sp. A19_0 TaxID=2821087 RepID=UPI001ADAEE0E|nr:iron-sulfur cluster insertion protein ErpA [Brevundimonas sp. A19_0]MBO9502598.1 iron-sulfur cluster insertion protein ErpA [Brevundimonas sp. A19_0]